MYTRTAPHRRPSPRQYSSVQEGQTWLPSLPPVESQQYLIIIITAVWKLFPNKQSKCVFIISGGSHLCECVPPPLLSSCCVECEQERMNQISLSPRSGNLRAALVVQRETAWLKTNWQEVFEAEKTQQPVKRETPLIFLSSASSLTRQEHSAPTHTASS